MVGHGAIPLCRNRAHAADVDEKRDELPGARGEILCTWQISRIVGEQLWVMPAYHAGAGSGRDDDVVIISERLDDLDCDRLRVGAVARIIRRLPTTGLGARNLDRAAGLFEEPNGSKADGRPKQIHKTTREQRYTHLGYRRSAATVRGYSAAKSIHAARYRTAGATRPGARRRATLRGSSR